MRPSLGAAHMVEPLCQRDRTIQSFVGVGQWTISAFLLRPVLQSKASLLVIPTSAADGLPTALTVVFG
jgi:hypothetical protein